MGLGRRRRGGEDRAPEDRLAPRQHVLDGAFHARPHLTADRPHDLGVLRRLRRVHLAGRQLLEEVVVPLLWGGHARHLDRWWHAPGTRQASTPCTLRVY